MLIIGGIVLAAGLAGVWQTFGRPRITRKVFRPYDGRRRAGEGMMSTLEWNNFNAMKLNREREQRMAGYISAAQAA